MYYKIEEFLNYYTNHLTGEIICCFDRDDNEDLILFLNSNEIGIHKPHSFYTTKYITNSIISFNQLYLF